MQTNAVGLAKFQLSHFRFGSKADICSAQAYVRFTPNSGHQATISDHRLRLSQSLLFCPFWMKSGHSVARRECLAVAVGASSRGRPLNAPAAFIHPCQPIVTCGSRRIDGGTLDAGITMHSFL